MSIYYKNNSEYNSFYFGILAKDADENLIADFDFTLRISIHDSSRTPGSQSEKKKQKAKLKEVLKFAKTKHLRTSVTVNDKAFDSWMDAFLEIDADIEHAVEIMTRRVTK